MKKKLLLFFLSIISAVCLAAGLSACDASTLIMEEGIVYLTDFSVKYTSDTESPLGDIDESTLAETKSGSVQSYYLVMSFDMQTASNIEDIEYLYVKLTVLNADVVSTTINYTNTSSTSEKTSGGKTTITATYSLPEKAKVTKNVQLVIELKPNTEGTTDIVYDFSSTNKSVTGYCEEDTTYVLSSSDVKITQTYLEYTLSENGRSYSVTDTGTKSGTVYIRETYNGLPVTAIGDYAFDDISSITIPDSVTSIGNSAFFFCPSLESVYYNGSVFEWVSISFSNTTANPLYYAGNLYINGTLLTDLKDTNITSISAYAFAGWNIPSITIPESVTFIGKDAFYECSLLESVYYSGTASEWAGISFGNTTANPLYYAGNLYINGELSTDITLEGIASIGDYAFSGCTSFQSITIPDKVTSIGKGAFYNCNSLTNITIPNSVTSIGDDAFRNCYKLVEVNNLSSLNITAGGKAYGYVGYNAKNVNNSDSGSSNFITQENYLFYDDNGTYYLMSYTGSDTVLTLPDLTVNGVTVNYSIYQYAFSCNTKITEVTIPDGVTSIGDSAFSRCTSLTTVTLGDEVKTIGNYAFYGCSYITEVTIPQSVTMIGAKAFYGCSSITGVVVPSSVTSIGEGAFEGCSSLKSITLPFVGSSLTDAVFTNFGHVFGAASYESNSSCVPSSLTTVVITGGASIYSYAFYGCSSIIEVTIPQSATMIGAYAFYGCSSMTSITIENTVVYGWYFWNSSTKCIISFLDPGETVTYLVNRDDIYIFTIYKS